MDKKLKIAIIGANGYLARNFIYFLRQQYGNTYELSLYGHQDAFQSGEEQYQQIDFSSDHLDLLNLQVDIIYLFAGKTGTFDSFNEFDSFIDINEKVVLKILNEYRKQQSNAKLIFPSTRLVYKGANRPLLETDEKEFKTVYAMTKFSCENYLQMYHTIFGVQYAILRIGVPYGSLVSGISSYGTAEFMLSKAEKGENIPLYGGGSLRRTLTYIKDVCRYLHGVGIHQECLNDVYNIGGEDCSLLEMANGIASQFGVLIESVPWNSQAQAIESGSTVFDSSKLDSLLQLEDLKCFQEWVQEFRSEGIE